jgi:intracellular sulfur oxidation DsrE/DsrF family protein
MLKIKSQLIVALFMALALVSGSALMSTQAAAEESAYGKQKVVYHINYDDPKLQAGALRNVQNHINAVGKDNIDIKVVLHGNGLALLLEPDSLEKLTKFTPDMAAKIDGLKAQGVAFNVCANTVRGRKVDLETDLYNVSESDIVPSGVAEVAKLQQEGYVYIKP